MSPPADARRRHPGRGNRHLKTALGTAAMSITRQRNTSLHEALKTTVPIERAILTAIWHMPSTGPYYRDSGPDYYSRHNPANARPVPWGLRALGYQFTITNQKAQWWARTPHSRAHPLSNYFRRHTGPCALGLVFRGDWDC